MINSYFKEDIVKHLASIIDYGIISRYSFRGIEELIIKSSFVDELEKNYFDSNRSIDQNITRYCRQVDTSAAVAVGQWSLCMGECCHSA